MGRHRISRPFSSCSPKNPKAVLEILEPFDLTGALRGAAELAGCDRNRIAHWVRARAGRRRLPAPVLSGPRVDAFAEMIDDMDAVGLRRRTEGRRPVDGVVLRVAGLLALQRDRSAVASDNAVGCHGARSRVPGVGGAP